jgi:hypothetical protein
MPSKKPRLIVTFEVDHYATLRRLAKVQGCSMGSIVNDLVGEMSPVLNRLATLLEVSANASQCVKAAMRAAADQAQTEMAPMVMEVLRDMDKHATTFERLAADNVCSCTITDHERQESKECPVHGPEIQAFKERNG